MVSKIIHVCGSGSTGKTSSLFGFLDKLGVYVQSSRGRKFTDISIVFPYTINGRTYSVGVGTAGDELSIITHNINFFITHNVDIIICATRSRGSAYNYVANTAHSHHATHIKIQTKKVTGQPAILAHINSIVNAINSNFP